MEKISELPKIELFLIYGICGDKKQVFTGIITVNVTIYTVHVISFHLINIIRIFKTGLRLIDCDRLWLWKLRPVSRL